MQCQRGAMGDGMERTVADLICQLSQLSKEYIDCVPRWVRVKGEGVLSLKVQKGVQASRGPREVKLGEKGFKKRGGGERT